MNAVEEERLRLATAHLVSVGLIIIKCQDTSGECPCCHQAKSDIGTRRLNTAYADDASNWLESCLECYDDAIATYREMWDDYYAGISL